MQHFQSIFEDIFPQLLCTYLIYKLAITLSFFQRQLNNICINYSEIWKKNCWRKINNNAATIIQLFPRVAARIIIQRGLVEKDEIIFSFSSQGFFLFIILIWLGRGAPFQIPPLGGAFSLKVECRGRGAPQLRLFGGITSRLFWKLWRTGSLGS